MILFVKNRVNVVPKNQWFGNINKNDLFEIEIYNSITIKDKEDNEKNKIEITKDLNKILEGMILKDPGQWIWTHNRWK